jgi:hypothetical protein
LSVDRLEFSRCKFAVDGWKLADCLASIKYAVCATLDYALDTGSYFSSHNHFLSVKESASQPNGWNKSGKRELSWGPNCNRLAYIRTTTGFRRTTNLRLLSNFFMKPDLNIQVTTIERNAWKFASYVSLTQGNVTKGHVRIRFLSVRVWNSGRAIAQDCVAFAQLPSQMASRESKMYPHQLRWEGAFEIQNIEEGKLLDAVMSCFKERTEIINQTGKALHVLFTM